MDLGCTAATNEHHRSHRSLMPVTTTTATMYQNSGGSAAAAAAHSSLFFWPWAAAAQAGGSAPSVELESLYRLSSYSHHHHHHPTIMDAAVAAVANNHHSSASTVTTPPPFLPSTVSMSENGAVHNLSLSLNSSSVDRRHCTPDNSSISNRPYTDQATNHLRHNPRSHNHQVSQNSVIAQINRSHNSLNNNNNNNINHLAAKIESSSVLSPTDSQTSAGGSSGSGALMRPSSGTLLSSHSPQLDQQARFANHGPTDHSPGGGGLVSGEQSNGEANSPAARKQSGSPATRAYKCKICHELCFSRHDLSKHNASVHKQDPRPYQCEHCGRQFSTSAYLSQHRRIHLGVKPYACRFCDRRFTQLSHVQQHERIHTGEKPYRCHTCFKSFTQMSNLQSHQRQHMKGKPCRCESCFMCFDCQEELDTHIQSKHAVHKYSKVLVCPICSKNYNSETYLNKHIQKHRTEADNQTDIATTSNLHPVSSNNLTDSSPQSLPLDSHDQRIDSQPESDMPNLFHQPVQWKDQPPPAHQGTNQSPHQGDDPQPHLNRFKSNLKPPPHLSQRLHNTNLSPPGVESSMNSRGGLASPPQLQSGGSTNRTSAPSPSSQLLFNPQLSNELLLAKTAAAAGLSCVAGHNPSILNRQRESGAPPNPPNLSFNSIGYNESMASANQRRPTGNSFCQAYSALINGQTERDGDNQHGGGMGSEHLSGSALHNGGGGSHLNNSNASSLISPYDSMFSFANFRF